MAVLAVVAWFFYRHLWPWLKQQQDRIHEVLIQQLQVAQDARTKALTDFMEALERRDTEFKKVVVALDRLSEEKRTRKR